MPKFPAIAPLTISGGARRRFPWKDSSRSMKVPLVDEAEELTGKIVVPLRLCNTQEHTNERHEFDKLIRENLARWAEWRRQRGWEMASKPHVEGPYLPPGSDPEKAKDYFARAKKVIGEGRQIRAVTEFDAPEEVRWYFATATFRRSAPVYVGLDDALYLRDLHRIYSQPEPEDSGWVNPMVYAEERRQRMGIRRKDYLLGRLEDPL